jgi:AcrR family transcriptional regulator
VPRAVDHETRRTELVDALWRVVQREGVDKATMRSIASEAGVSIGMVQHYFADKDEILAAAVRARQAWARTRFERAMRQLGDDPDPRSVIATALRHRLPLTRERQHEAWVLLHAVRATRPGTSRTLLSESAHDFAAVLAGALERARDLGQVPAALDVAAATDALVALNDGLMLGLLVGRFTGPRALRAMESHLDSVLASAPPG